MSNPIDTDNWVEITATGREALMMGTTEVSKIEKSETTPGEDAQLARDLSSELRGSLSTSVIFSDLDNFKAVNDNFGHDTGDRCIDNFRRIITEIVRDRGKVYRRYGRGDEFVTVLHNATAGEAAATAERIRRAVETSNLGGTVPVTASLGISSTDTGLVTNPMDLVKLADQMMYKVKETKNSVMWPETAAELIGAANL